MTSPISDILIVLLFNEKYLDGIKSVRITVPPSITEAEQALTALLEAAIGEDESKRPGMTMAQLHDIAIRNSQRDDIRQKLGIGGNKG